MIPEIRGVFPWWFGRNTPEETSTLECLRKRNSQIRFHKKYVRPRNIVEFHKIKVTNSTILSNSVERLHKLCPTTFIFDQSSILWTIDSAFASQLPLRIWDSTNKIRTFFVKFRFVNSAVANTLFRVIFFYITEIRFKGQFYRSHLAVWANAVFLLYSAVPTRKL